MIDFKHIRSLTTSPLKLRILERLKDPINISSLAKFLNVPRDTVKPHIRSFVKAGLIEKDRKGYKLTVLGRIVLEKAIEIEKILSIAEDDIGEFFKTHDLSCIPEDLMRDIHNLYGGYLIRTVDPFEISEDWIKMLEDSSWVKGVSPVYHPEFPVIFTHLAEKRNVILILTEDVFKKCTSKHPELLKRFLKFGEMRVCSDARIAFVVAEKGFVMGLYRGDVFDANCLFICKSNDAVQWGLKLFDYFYTKSEVKYP